MRSNRYVVVVVFESRASMHLQMSMREGDVPSPPIGAE